jgi:hypothetical protein
MQRRVLRAFVTVMSTASIAVGSMVSGAASASARPPVPVHATTTHPVIAPSFLQPGLVHLRNTGGDPLYVFRKKSHDVATLVRELNDEQASSDVPKLFRDFLIIDILSGHRDVYLRLRPGTYYLVDLFAEHYHAADVHSIVVQGQVSNAKVHASRSITVRKNGHLAAPTHGRAGHLFHYRNNTSPMHELELLPVRKSVTKAQLADFLAHPTPKKLFAIVSFSIHSFELPLLTSGHEDLYTRFPKRAGRYIVLSIPVRARANFGLSRHHLALLTVR